MNKIKHLYSKIWYQALLQKGELFTMDEWAFYLLFAFTVLAGGIVLGFVTMINFFFGVDVYSIFGITNEIIFGSKIYVVVFSILLFFGVPFFLNYYMYIRKNKYLSVIEEFSKGESNKTNKTLLIGFVLFSIVYPLFFGYLNNFRNF